MFIIIPIFSFFLFWFKFYQHNQLFRLSFLYACALWGLIAWFFTEGLSVCHALNYFSLAIGWGLVFGGVVLCIMGDLRRQVFNFTFPAVKDFTFTEKLVIFFILTIAFLKGISAFTSAPNTSDAFVYHLNRVEHWIQNRTVANYPTHVTRQLYSPPWAEYIILQLRLLSQGDYFSNAVQWFSALGSWVVVSGLARLLGANRLGQLLSVLLAAALPMGLVQATSTQTDYVMTFWLSGFVYLLWSIYLKPGWKNSVAAGIFLGLALLTKGTAYLFVPVWIVAFIIALMVKRYWLGLKILVLVAGIACMINFPYAQRNAVTFGKPYWTHIALTNEDISLPTIFSNLAFNLSLHMHFHGQSTGEDDAPNFLYTVISLIVFLGLIACPHLWRSNHLVYFFCIAGIVLLFSLIVHPDPFNSRFHLGFFILSTALVGTVMTAWFAPRWIALIAVLVCLSSWPWLLKSNEHPLMGPRSIFISTREQQYFSERPVMVFPYEQTVKLIASGSCRDIGLISNENEWGYPWWVMMRQQFGDHFRLEDVEVKNMSGSLPYPRGNFVPCGLIATDDQRSIINLSYGIYARIWSAQLPNELTSVFIKVK